MKDDDSETAFYAGRLHWWNGNSYGFIRPDGSTGKDLFVHKSELPEGYTAKIDDRVTYRVANNLKQLDKTHAVDVRIAAV